MSRLVALGDAHLGRSHLAHLRDDEGRNLREEDFLRSFAWAVDETIRQEPDGFLWLGDIFDHARPTYRTFAHVLGGLQRLRDAGLPGVAISGNHDTPRVRGTGSPYDALERVFPGVAFAWRMEAMAAELAGVAVHAVPQTLSVEELRGQLAAAAGRGPARRHEPAARARRAHLAAGADYRDINELEVEEAAFAPGFDLVLLGHYHAHQKVSKRTWYAGSTDTFSYADSPEAAKGLVVIDTDTGTVEHVENPHERPLATVSVAAAGLSAGELVDAVERAARGIPEGAIVRVYLNEVDPASFRQVASEQFHEAVPGAIWVQVEPDFGAEALSRPGRPHDRVARAGVGVLRRAAGSRRPRTRAGRGARRRVPRPTPAGRPCEGPRAVAPQLPGVRGGRPRAAAAGDRHLRRERQRQVHARGVDRLRLLRGRGRPDEAPGDPHPRRPRPTAWCVSCSSTPASSSRSGGPSRGGDTRRTPSCSSGSVRSRRGRPR